MHEYETLYLLAPDLSTDKQEEFNRKISDLIKTQGGQVLTQFNWGKRKLAYRVAKHLYGIYIYLNYLGQGGLVSELERVLRLDDHVLKFVTVKLDEHVNIEERSKQKREFTLTSYEETTPSIETPAA